MFESQIEYVISKSALNSFFSALAKLSYLPNIAKKVAKFNFVVDLAKHFKVYVLVFNSSNDGSNVSRILSYPNLFKAKKDDNFC